MFGDSTGPDTTSSISSFQCTCMSDRRFLLFFLLLFSSFLGRGRTLGLGWIFGWQLFQWHNVWGNGESACMIVGVIDEFLKVPNRLVGIWMMATDGGKRWEWRTSRAIIWSFVWLYDYLPLM